MTLSDKCIKCTPKIEKTHMTLEYFWIKCGFYYSFENQSVCLSKIEINNELMWRRGCFPQEGIEEDKKEARRPTRSWSKTVLEKAKKAVTISENVLRGESNKDLHLHCDGARCSGSSFGIRTPSPPPPQHFK